MSILGIILISFRAILHGPTQLAMESRRDLAPARSDCTMHLRRPHGHSASRRTEFSVGTGLWPLERPTFSGEVVEAAGVEPDSGSSANLLMGCDLRWNPLPCCQFVVLWSVLESSGSDCVGLWERESLRPMVHAESRDFRSAL